MRAVEFEYIDIKLFFSKAISKEDFAWSGK